MSSTWATWCCILVVHVYSNSVLANSTSCPTWFYYSNASTKPGCKCGHSTSWRIHCNQQKRNVVIADGYCTTSAGHVQGQYYAGLCPFRHTENNMDRMFSELPSDPNQLNVMMCGPYNRTGLLCGRCIDEYGPAVYSVDMKCANCSRLSTGYAISVYVLLELIPVTLVFICMIIFRINITAGPLLGYVIFCQVYVFYFKTYLYIYEYNYSLTRICTTSSTVLLFTDALWLMDSTIWYVCDSTILY